MFRRSYPSQSREGARLQSAASQFKLWLELLLLAFWGSICVVGILSVLDDQLYWIIGHDRRGQKLDIENQYAPNPEIPVLGAEQYTELCV